jgi:hypothetical protein
LTPTRRPPPSRWSRQRSRRRSAGLAAALR